VDCYYFVWLNIKGKLIYFVDSYLSAFVPERVVKLMETQNSDDLGLCEHCTLNNSCHVIGIGGTKYCIVLFHDAFKPKWKIKDLA